MAAKTPNKNQRQKQAMIRIVIMAAILICANILASYFHTGADLTKERRFTLSPSTKKLLHNMQEVAVVDVYLKGKFPAYLQRLQEAVRERLRSFKDIAGSKIVFRFIDPFEGKTLAEQKQIAHDLHLKGIEVLELAMQGEEEYSSKPFFPFALVQYNGKEMPVYLLETTPNKTTAEQVTSAEAKLEYKFAHAIDQMSKPDFSHIAYITGNDEELGMKTMDMLRTLPRFYYLDTLDLMHVLNIPLAYDAIIINQPKTAFTGPEKLKIDQYIMRGGHVMWVVNTLKASLDSFAHSPQFIAMEYGLDLDDVLFKYGVRVNNDLVEDMQNLPLPRIMEEGGQPTLHEWAFFPLLNPTTDHPIVRNMDFIRSGFTNSIDTIRSASIKKTVLLHSSKYSLAPRSPVRVSLSIMSFPLKNEMFTKSYLPVAVLLEGKFHSAYKNLLAPEYLRLLDSLNKPFKPECDSSNSMIVISGGDIFSSTYSAKDGILPMGYYQYNGQFYANKDFLLNCLEYLTDHSGVLEARSKDIKLRLLDNGRVKREKTQWQAINIGIPIALVLIFASCYFFFRKRRYEQPQNTKTL
jgi:ABC-2 type transport system permease protein